MNYMGNGYRRSILLIAALLPAMLHAQQLPDGRAVLARYAKATNAEKVSTLPGHRAKGTFELSSAGLKGTAEAYSDHKGRAALFVAIPGLGDLREGMDTSFAWSMNPLEGPKLIQGKEFTERRELEDPRSMRRDPALVMEATTLERATVDSQPCIKVRLKWKSGRETRECYSESTGLLVSTESTQTSAMGELAVTTIYRDYKVFDGITMPTKTIQRAAGTDIVLTWAEIVFGPVDESKLVTPPEIVALRKK